jgi:YVTN family beta-propeller protein
VVDETSSEADRLAFGLLGPLQVTRAGVPVPLGGRQQRAVLALLLAEGGTVVSLPRIADALWGEHVPAGFAATVQTYVFHLREVLEPGRERGMSARVLVTEPGGYRLRGGDAAVDATRFEQLVRDGRAQLAQHESAGAAASLTGALALWRGEVLADLADFDFVAPLAARLQQLRRSAIGSRIEAELALGHHHAAIGELDELVARHPLDEELHAARILALYRGGRQSDALDAYRGVRTVLRDELGIEPGSRLQQLHRDVLTHDPKLDRPSSSSEMTAGDGHPASVPEATGAQSVPPGQGRRVRSRRRRWLIGAAAAAVLAAAGSITAVVAANSPRSSLRALPANGVGAMHADGSLHDAVRVGLSPAGLAYGAGSLWATNTTDGTVSRIDPATHAVVDTIAVGAAPAAVTVTGDAVWVANSGDGTVSWINASSNTVVDTVRVGTLPSTIASGPGGLWVANSGDDTVQRIDPGTGETGPAIPVGAGPDGIAVDQHAVWVANGRDGTVSKLDAKTGARLKLIPVGAGAEGLAVVSGAVWVANSLELTVSRIDPATDRVVATVQVGDGPSSVVAGPTSVWVSDEYDGTLAEIDSASDHERRRLSIGGSPRGLALVGSTLWLAVDAFSTPGHVGGTLTVDSASSLPGAVDGIDPANNDDWSFIEAEGLIYDGLVGFRHVDGAAGGVTLVPDLAATLPRPTDGGLTYAFTLRPGIRYSTGTTVQAADIRRGLQRALTLGSFTAGYYSGVVGARSCQAHPTSCDLSRGVWTDDATRRVTFHLTAPDPGFLDKLTRFVYPAPSDSPTMQVKAPQPGTGPYMISGYKAGEKQFTLTRNPYFRQWSYAAQPTGYPDVIRWRQVPELSRSVTDVVAGRADMLLIMNDTPREQLPILADLARRYPARLHPVLWFQTSYAFLNTAVAPFNDIRVRQALNYAVDRSHLVDLAGGAALAAPTCQFFPPDFPGYQHYCPYTAGPSGKAGYQGPNLAAARRLVAASATAGTAVTVVGPDINLASDEYFVSLLRELRYRAMLREIPDLNRYFAYVFDSRNRVQIGVLYWAADFPTPANFFDVNLSCNSFVPANPASNGNPSQYCRPAVDKLAAEALAAQTTDPTYSCRLWAQVDRTITDDAPVVATVNGKIETFVSTRLGNFQSNPQLGPLFDQMWIQ